MINVIIKNTTMTLICLVAMKKEYVNIADWKMFE